MNFQARVWTFYQGFFFIPSHPDHARFWGGGGVPRSLPPAASPSAPHVGVVDVVEVSAEAAGKGGGGEARGAGGGGGGERQGEERAGGRQMRRGKETEAKWMLSGGSGSVRAI